MQGLLLHSFTSERHLGSWKPSGHRQVKPLMPSLHVPPLWQGLLAHSSMLMLHMRPGKGGARNSYPISMDGMVWGVHPPDHSPSSRPGNVCWRLGSGTHMLAAEEWAALQAG